MAREKTEIPADYIPKTAAPGGMVFWDEDGLEALEIIPQEDFKDGFLTILLAAKKYSETFSPDVKPDLNRFDPTTRFALGILFRTFKRGLDSWRETCWKRSNNNKGNGTGENNGNDKPVVSASEPEYSEVRKWLDDHHYTDIKVTDALKFIREHPDPNGRWEGALLTFVCKQVGNLVKPF